MITHGKYASSLDGSLSPRPPGIDAMSFQNIMASLEPEIMKVITLCGNVNVIYWFRSIPQYGNLQLYFTTYLLRFI